MTGAKENGGLTALVQRALSSAKVIAEPCDAAEAASQEDAAADNSNLEPAPSCFDMADDLERGLVAEAVLAKTATSPVNVKEPLRRCCIFHLETPGDEYQLLSSSGDMLLTAKFFRRARRLEFYFAGDEGKRPAQQSQGGSETPRRRPFFTMTYSENNDYWVLKQNSCEHCMQRPKHLSCETLGNGQQVAFIQHRRQKVGKALVHFVDVRLPALVDETESMVWCPVTLGRDLCDKAPVEGGDTPKRHPSRRSNNSSGSGFSLSRSPSRSRGLAESCATSYTSEGRTSEGGDDDTLLRVCTKVPFWDEVVGSLVLHFKDRTVQSCPMNFMLCRKGDPRTQVIMQHAKLSKNTYCLDFGHPLSTVQAFAIALTGLLWD